MLCALGGVGRLESVKSKVVHTCLCVPRAVRGWGECRVRVEEGWGALGWGWESPTAPSLTALGRERKMSCNFPARAYSHASVRFEAVQSNGRRTYRPGSWPITHVEDALAFSHASAMPRALWGLNCLCQCMPVLWGKQCSCFVCWGIEKARKIRTSLATPSY